MEWQGILEGLPVRCREVVTDQGASDPVDVKYLWANLNAFLLDVQPADEEELEACRIFHLRCELAGSREISMRATEVVSRRNSILTSSSRPLPRNPSSPASCGGLLQLRLRPCPWSRVVPRLLNVLWMS